jgi:hypothetical protein
MIFLNPPQGDSSGSVIGAQEVVWEFTPFVFSPMHVLCVALMRPTCPGVVQTILFTNVAVSSLIYVVLRRERRACCLTWPDKNKTRDENGMWPPLCTLYRDAVRCTSLALALAVPHWAIS